MKSILLVFLLSIGIVSKGQLKVDSIDYMIGQMIMIGIGDFDMADKNLPVFREVAEGKVGGVVLYEKNIRYSNPKGALALLVGTLQKNAKIPLLVSIDEEGGNVSRLKTRYGFPKNVSAQYLGTLNNIDSTCFYGEQTASILKSFGINMNYAPVVDINLNDRNPVIGRMERSYSSEYREVIKQADAVVKTHQKFKVIPVLKHFPGHGSSKSDTHLGLTDVTHTWQIEEIYPYAALIDTGTVDAIMTAHIVNQTLDKSKRPATLSKKIVDEMLRDFLHFDGVIISDDLQMGAIRNEYGLREAIRLSIEAGVDMLMFANNVKDYDLVTASTVHGIIKDFVFEETITRERIYASYKRIMALKRKYGLLENDFYKDLKNRLKQYN